MDSTATAEILAGDRFQFGDNWSKFLDLLDSNRINAAEESLQRFLGIDNLKGLSFVDIGSGSGLFSLAARRLGARVHSFDFDPQSVACTNELKKRFFPSDLDWIVESGSALDNSYVSGLGQFDIVYSWGVLHHTGDMWKALALAETRVKPGGYLFISIYNDQGGTSKRWRLLKQTYCKLPRPVRPLLVCAVAGFLECVYILVAVLNGRSPLGRFSKEGKGRGMAVWRDWVDWVGGYPFEVAKPEEIFRFYRDRGYTLKEISTCGGGHGCNQYLLKKTLDVS